MKRLHVEKEPEVPSLTEHLWTLVLQHLDTVQDHVKASTSCRAAWKAGFLKLDVPEQLSSKGRSPLIYSCAGLCALHMDMTGRALTCPW